MALTYGASPTDITPSGLNGLGSGLSVVTATQSGTSSDYLIEINVNGTASATAYLSVYLLGSEGGTNYDTLASARLLGAIYLSSTPQQATFSIANDSGLGAPPKNWEIIIVNNTGAALGASGNTVKMMTVQYG